MRNVGAAGMNADWLPSSPYQNGQRSPCSIWREECWLLDRRVSVVFGKSILVTEGTEMVSIFLAVLLSSVTSDQSLQQNYADAYKESVENNKPLMVVVGAPWCHACNVLKESTIRPMASSGELDTVSLTVINPDEDPDLARQLTEGEAMLPQIIVFTKDNGRWKRSRLMGYQTKQPVRSLVRRALNNS